MDDRDQAAEKLAAKARESGIPIPEDASVRIEVAQKFGFMVFVELKWFDEEEFKVYSVPGWAFANGEATFGWPLQPGKMDLLS